MSVVVAVGACSSDDVEDTPPGGGTGADAGTSKTTEGGASSSSSSGDAGPAVPTEPAVQYVGRFLVDGEARTVGWPGSRIVARFEGTSVSAKLDETPLYEGPSVFDVKVDGTTTKLTLEEGAKTYELAKDLAAGPHQVELFRRTEGQVGLTIFRGLDFGGGKLLPPPPPKLRRIEILGDSGSTGYGVECTDPSGTFTGATQNFGKAWPAKLGAMFDADVIAIGYGGKGVIQNFDRSDPVHMEDLFVRTVPESADPKWDFSKSPVDVLVVMLGGNDWDQPNPGDPAPGFAAFKAGYAKLIGLAREKYPKAKIVSALAPTQSDEYPEGYQARSNQRKAFTEVVAERKSGGDDAIAFVEVAKSTESEQTGCEFHPNEGLHTRIANEIAAAVKSATGW